MRNRVTLWFMLGVVVSCMFFPSDGSASVIVKKTFKRVVDPVVMEGSFVQEMAGVPLSNLRMYSYKDGAFSTIRFQIDEMTKDGDWIFEFGKLSNKELSNGKFDTWDMIVFMAEDTGDKVDKEEWVSGYTKGTEVEVIDSLTGEKGWCYVFYFASNPPSKSSLPNYVRYDNDTNTVSTDYWGAKAIITKDGKRTCAFEKMWVTGKAGGNGKNFVDRAKGRGEVRLFWKSMVIRLNEEQLKSDTLAYTGGTIRQNGRVEQYARIDEFVKIHIPGLSSLKLGRVVTDVASYRNIVIVPIFADIPVRLNTFVTSAVFRFGTDFHPDIKGHATTYNSVNTQGFAVDGKMDDGEKNFKPDFDNWRVITGDFGTYLSRTIIPENFMKHGTIKMGLVDDDTYNYPPETHLGSVGYLWQDWILGDLPKGSYHFYLAWCFPPSYKPGDEDHYVKFMDSPLKVKSGLREGKSQIFLVPKIGKRYETWL